RDLGLPHIRFELILRVATRNQVADLDSSSGKDGDAFFRLGRADVSSNAARSVTRDLGMRSVRIDKAYFDIVRRMGKHPLDAVGPNAVMSITDTAREFL